MAAPAQRSASLAIRGPLREGDLPGLLERACALLRRDAFDVLRCELCEVAADAVALDALARLALAARRRRRSVLLCGASPELLALVDFAGLGDALRAEVPGRLGRPAGADY
jgi:ABC-type transporter Mla MlaB component